MLDDWMGGWAGKPGAFAKKKNVGSTQGALHDYLFLAGPSPGPIRIGPGG